MVFGIEIELRLEGRKGIVLIGGWNGFFSFGVFFFRCVWERLIGCFLDLFSV